MRLAVRPTRRIPKEHLKAPEGDILKESWLLGVIDAASLAARRTDRPGIFPGLDVNHNRFGTPNLIQGDSAVNVELDFLYAIQ